MKKFFAYLCAVSFAVSHVMAQTEMCNNITYTTTQLPCAKDYVSPCGPRTLFLPRSQGSNMARYLAGWKEYLPGCDDRCWGNVSLALEYSHSLNGYRMAQYLFGSTCLTFSGSQVTNRGPNDILADYVGLPVTFVGTICFSPRIDNIILDFNYDIGLDHWCPGLFFRVLAPIVVTRWDLGTRCNEMNNLGPQSYPTFPKGYMSSDTTDPIPTLLSIRGALSGSSIFGDMDQPISFGAFPCGRDMRSGIADIEFVLGLNVVANECGHFGLYLDTQIPFGNRPHSLTIFEPIFGNGNLWEVGTGITAHYDLFTRGYHKFAIYLEGVLNHMFKRWQIRSMDLIGNGPLSRYMLTKEFNSDGSYSNMMKNAIDFMTHDIRGGGSVKLDLAVKASYYYDRWGVDLGYNVYARSKEKLRLDVDLSPSDLNNRAFGLKGQEGDVAFIYDLATGQLTGDSVPLLSTCSTSTIHAGGPVDNPIDIETPPGTVAITYNSSTNIDDLTVAFNSDPEIILNPGVFDIRTCAIPHQLTHKFFWHIEYTALHRAWEPQFGIGGEIEVDGRPSLVSSLNQWGVWLKGAIAF